MGHIVYVRTKKTKPGKQYPGHWPEAKKIEAVTAYLALGTLPLTAAHTKLPLNTLMTWKKKPWWKEIEQKIKDEDNQELDSKLSNIIKKTLNVIEDRLDNGNFQYDQKTGRVLRVPVNIRDTHRVMSDLVNQRRVIRKEPTVADTPANTVNDRLITLAEQFAQFALGKKNTDSEMKITTIYENEMEELVEKSTNVSETKEE